ncbi:MAG: sulfite exporter TauE/SafE family protein, partial [Dehalococcoidia bacterium]
SGVLAHRKVKKVSRGLLLFMGSASFVGSLAGAVVSKYLQAAVLTIIFVGLAILAAGLMFIPRKEWGEDIPVEQVRFNRPLASGIALGIGALGGTVGAPGAFILIPLQLYVLKIPTRIAVGSTLGIVLLGATAGLLGKLVTGQVSFPLAAALVAGALPGAWFGASASIRVKVKALRLILAVVITAAALRMLYNVLVS